MATEQVLTLIKGHPFLEGVKPAVLERLAPLGREVRFKKDEIIFREGDDVPEFSLLISGLIALEVESQGKTVRLQTLGPGEELGWSSLLQSRRKYFQARCLEPVHAVSFDGYRLATDGERDCELGFTVMNRAFRLLARRLHSTRLQLLDSFAAESVRSA
jgi:CRP/FNR family transcriptional regulator, cyclic AMP receptor protein